MKIPKSPPINIVHCKVGNAMAYSIPRMTKVENASPTFHMILTISNLFDIANIQRCEQKRVKGITGSFHLDEDKFMLILISLTT